MLEKMGWTSGGGLGKNEDGRTEHIDLKVKTNLKGVGFVHGKYDSTWIAHSQGFDSLLEQLQQSHPSATNKSAINDLNENVQQTKTRFVFVAPSLSLSRLQLSLCSVTRNSPVAKISVVDRTMNWTVSSAGTKLLIRATIFVQR